jgi:antitoxin component YwqK of YwqJK toxin-antitoxin module
MKIKLVLIISTIITIFSCKEITNDTTPANQDKPIVSNYTSSDTVYDKDNNILSIKFTISSNEYTKVNFYKSGKRKEINPVKGGQCHGEYIDWFENGEIKWIRKYENGNQIGESETYYPNGSLKQYINFSDHTIIDYFQNSKPMLSSYSDSSLVYYMSGSIKNKYHYINDSITEIEFRNEDGNNVILGTNISNIFYINEKPYNGEIVSLFNNSDTSLFHSYDNGILNGVFFNKYGNGNLLIESKFKEGKPCETEKTYYPNGELKSSTNYTSSEYQFWNEYGKLIENKMHNN